MNGVVGFATVGGEVIGESAGVIGARVDGDVAVNSFVGSGDVDGGGDLDDL